MKVDTAHAFRLTASLLAVAVLMALTGCGAEPAPAPVVPDMEPIGSGLKFIGIGLVVTALVVTLGLARD